MLIFLNESNTIILSDFKITTHSPQLLSDANPEKSEVQIMEDGEIVKAVLVRSRKEFKRQDGSYVRFSDNAAVLIDNPKDKNPRGTRIFGPIAREIRDRGFAKITSMAMEVV